MVPLLSSSKKEVPELWSRTLPKQEGFLRKGHLSLLQLAQTQMTTSTDPPPQLPKHVKCSVTGTGHCNFLLSQRFRNSRVG